MDDLRLDKELTNFINQCPKEVVAVKLSTSGIIEAAQLN